jgi:hypothetical protein
MRWLLLLACSCNQVLGVHTTHLADAPTPDAPFTCPDIGKTPQFAPGFHQVVVGQCYGGYMTTGVRAVAICNFSDSPLLPVGEGPADQLLSPAAGVTNTLYDVIGVRLTPDGDEMLVEAERLSFFNLLAAPFLQMYQRGNDGTWSVEYALGIPVTDSDAIGTFTAGDPIGRRLVIGGALDSTLHEYSYDGTAWNAGWAQPISELGVTSITGLALTSDGRRMVFSAGMPPIVYYTDRMDVGTSFRIADQLQNVPGVYDPFLTDDCARLYYAAGDIRAIFYSQQL